MKLKCCAEIASVGTRLAASASAENAVRDGLAAGQLGKGLGVAYVKRRSTCGRENVSMDVPRGLAKEADDPNCVVLAEREINDYLKTEIDALKAAIVAERH
jgi:hypothetical protein